MNQKILVVIGGGAAGFFCAINAAQQNSLLRVILVEKTSKLLSKVRVSGGGRCNVTHACFTISEMLKKYPRDPSARPRSKWKPESSPNSRNSRTHPRARISSII